MPARRQLLQIVSMLVAGLALSACGSGDTSTAGVDHDSSDTSEGAGTFPVTVEHKFGETLVEEEPARVVSVGYTEHDVLLQLGVVPVGVTDWYGDQPFATWPWAQDLLGDAEPE